MQQMVQLENRLVRLLWVYYTMYKRFNWIRLSLPFPKWHLLSNFYFLGNWGIKCFVLGEIWSHNWRHSGDLRKSCRCNSHVILHCLLLLLFIKTSTSSKTNCQRTVLLRYIERLFRLCRIRSIIRKKYAWCTCIWNMYRIFCITLGNRDACDPH